MAIDIGTLRASIEINSAAAAAGSAEAVKAMEKAASELQKIQDNITKHQLKLGKMRIDEAYKLAVTGNKSLIAAEKAAMGERVKERRDAWKTILAEEKEAVKAGVEAQRQSAQIGPPKDSLLAWEKQQRVLQVSESKVKDLQVALGRLQGGKVYVNQISQAFEVYNAKLSSGKLSARELATAQHDLNMATAKVKREAANTSPQLNGMQLHMSEMAKTATVALGPLNGVASRITALTSIAKASALPLATLLGGFAAFAVLTGKSVIAGALMESQLFKLENASRAFGNQTALTTSQLNAMAVGLAENTLTSTALAREAVTALLAFRGLGDNTERIIYLAQDLTTTFGGSLLENTKRLGQVMENPIRALENLGESGVRFTTAQKKMIEGFVRTGQAAKASNMILKAVEERVGKNGQKEALGLAGAWDTLNERITNFVETVGGVETKGGTLASIITQISNQIKEFTKSGEITESIGRVIGVTLQGIANVALFVTRNIEILTNAVIVLAVGGLAGKLVPSVIASVKWSQLLTVAFYKQAAATAFAAVQAKALSLAIASTGVGLIVTLLSAAAAKYFLFSDSVEKAADSQERMNRIAEKTAELEQKRLSVARAQTTRVTENITALEKYIKAKQDQLKSLAIQGKAQSQEYLAVASALKVSEEALASLRKEQGRLKAITAEDDTKKQAELNAQAYKLQMDQFDSLKGSFIDGAKAADEWTKALQIATTMATTAARAGETLNQEQRDFIRIVESLKQFDGYKSIRDDVQRYNNELEKSVQLVNFLRMGSTEYAGAINSTLAILTKRQELEQKYQDMGILELRSRAAALGLVNTELGLQQLRQNVINKELAQFIEISKRVSEANALKEIQQDTKNYLNTIQKARSISGVFIAEDVKKLEAFHTRVSEIMGKYAAQSTETQSAFRSNLIDEWRKVAGPTDPFAGVDLNNIEAVAVAVAKYKENLDRIGEARAPIEKFYEDLKSASDSWSAVATDAVSNFVKTGKEDFSDFADSVISDLIRITIQRGIMDRLFQSGGAKGFFSFLGSATIASAKGNVFGGGGVQAFAKGSAFTNSVVSKPTLFPFAKGTGLMGEAGPEAIMPLTRTRSGDLGVRVEGSGGGGIQISVMVDAKGTKVEGNDQQSNNLGRMIGGAVRNIIIQEKRQGGLLAGA